MPRVDFATYQFNHSTYVSVTFCMIKLCQNSENVRDIMHVTGPANEAMQR
jgi:hypothetical protein